MKKVMRRGVLALGVALFSASASALVQVPPATIAPKTDPANPSADHARVAAEYRLRAEDLQRQASDLDARVVELSHREGPMPAKWPALTSRQLRDAQHQAAEARRAIRESRARANQQRELAVESLAQ